MELVLKLAEKFGRVYYYTNWPDAFPKSAKAQVGRGLEQYGVYKVDYFWDYVPQADLICFFDTYSRDMVEYLRDKGKRVFGAGLSETLETDREYGREIQRTSGLPTQDTKIVKGLEGLEAALKESGDYYVKLNTFRGDIETFYAKDYNSAKIYLDRLAVELGARQDEIEFILEKKIQGIEPGVDTFVVDGKYPNYSMWGYERKGAGYIGKVEATDNLPEPVKIINDKLSPFFSQMSARTLWSTELIVDKNRKGYLIDPTVRAPMPVGSALHTEIWSNLAEFIWSAAGGQLIDLIPAYKYGCGVCFDSDWAGHNWLNVDVDEKLRNRIKFRAMLKMGDKYFIPPIEGMTSVCSVIGLGNSVDEAVKDMEKAVEGVNAFELNKETGGISDVIETIKNSVEYGLPDFTQDKG